VFGWKLLSRKLAKTFDAMAFAERRLRDAKERPGFVTGMLTFLVELV
jgi:hypothetical protein